MNDFHKLRAPLLFLGRFLLASTLLSLVWNLFSSSYLATVIPAVNGLFSLDGSFIRLEQYRQTLLLVYQAVEGEPLRLRFTGHEMVYLNSVAAMAVFAAVPASRTGWKLRWVAGVAALFWLAHVFSFYTGGHIAFWDYCAQLPVEKMRELSTPGKEGFPPGVEWIFRSLFGLWNTWGGPALIVTLWLFATQHYRDLYGEPED